MRIEQIQALEYLGSILEEADGVVRIKASALVAAPVTPGVQVPTAAEVTAEERRRIREIALAIRGKGRKLRDAEAGTTTEIFYSDDGTPAFILTLFNQDGKRMRQYEPG